MAGHRVDGTISPVRLHRIPDARHGALEGGSEGTREGGILVDGRHGQERCEIRGVPPSLDVPLSEGAGAVPEERPFHRRIRDHDLCVGSGAGAAELFDGAVGSLQPEASLVDATCDRIDERGCHRVPHRATSLVPAA